MTWLLVLILLVALVLVLPVLLEAQRRPMDDKHRADAPGEFVELSDGKTHYQWHGPRTDRVLVLVHGLSTPSWIFTGLVRGLLQLRYHVLSYDLYGRGFSDRVDEPQTLALHTRQLAELIDAVGIRAPVTLLGYSMGGMIAAAYTAEEPERVARLLLLAPGGMTYRPSKLQQFARDRGAFGNWVWGLLGARHLRQAARRDAGGPTVIPDLEARMSRETRTRGYLKAVLSSERHTLTKSMEPVHREIAAMYVPTLAIWGEADTVIPQSSVGQLAQWNRGARQVVVPGAGHGLGHTDPQEVLTAIREFQREVPD